MRPNKNLNAWYLMTMLFLTVIFSSFSVVTIYAQEIPLDQPRAIAWSPDGRQIAVGYQNGMLNILDTADFSIQFSIQAHTAFIGALDWNSETTLLASGASSPDNALRVWNTLTGQMIYEISGIGADIIAVAWIPHTNQIIVNTAEALNQSLGSAIINIDTQEVMPIRLGTTTDIEWNPDQTQIAVTRTANIQILDAHSFESIREYTYSRESTPPGISFPIKVVWHPNGEQFAVGMDNGYILIYDVDNPQPIQILSGHDYQGDDRFTKWIHALRFDETGETLTSISGSGIVRSWETSTWNLITEQMSNPNYAAAFSPLGVQFAVGLSPLASQEASLNRENVRNDVENAGINIFFAMPTSSALEAIAQQCDILDPTSLEDAVNRLETTGTTRPARMQSACLTELHALND